MSRYVLKRWEPEHSAFWEDSGKRIARRNLWISIPALMLAFSIWMLWSIVAINLHRVGFRFSENQLFWLTSLPALSGATLRIFYSFLIPVFGGRRWTAVSTALLLIPAVGMGFALQDPSTSYPVLLLLALLCGLGGGNFSSSMANISFFFPKSEKGLATGLNAGIGNLGVSIAQLIVPLVITVSVFGIWGGAPQRHMEDGVEQVLWLQNAGFIWVPFIVLSAVAAWFGMHDIADVRASFAEQAIVFRRKHNWLMCWLYVGTFGSFIGFSAGFAMLAVILFPDSNPMAYAFLGPLVGSLARPVGGWVADKAGGARVTLYVFAGMTAAVLGLMWFIPVQGQAGSFTGFLVMFVVLFFLSGLGNGSTFRMIPVIFLTERLREVPAGDAPAKARAMAAAATESAAVLGFSGAIGAYGGFFIPRSFGTSISMTGDIMAALISFILFYLSCMAVTWWYYARRHAPMPC